MTRASRARGFGLRTFLIAAAMLLPGLYVPSVAAAPDCVDAQQTPQAAIDMAKRCGQRVEVLSLRSENAQTFAKPQGGYTEEQSAEPRFARQADGSWARVDTTLRANGKTVTPAAAVLPVEFSAGGDGPAAKLRDGDRELSITWPFGALPKPVLSGNEATYPEVLPGVDLKLTASSQGFAQVLVVKNREAAKNPKLAKVKFGFATKGITAHAAGGGLEAKDSAGKVVFASPTPVMWDSGQDNVPHVGVLSKSAVEAKKKRTATMPVSAQNGELTVTPDAKLLDEAQYPVMIDPSWSGRLHDNAWTLVSNKSGHEGSVFWQGRNNQGLDYLSNTGTYGNAGTGRICDSVSSSGACLSAQYNVRSYFRMDTSGVKGKIVTGASFRIEQKWSFTCNPNSTATLRANVRSYFRMDTSGVKGKIVTGASFRIEQKWSFTCNPNSTATLRATDGITPSTTWNNQPGFWWDAKWGSTVGANRKVDAQHGCAGPGDVEFPFTDAINTAAANNWDHLTMVLHVDEGVVSSWKRFNAGSAVLAIDFNSIPNMPDQVTVDGKACATGAARPLVPTATPIIRARLSDPDPAEAMNSNFEWRRMRPNGTFGPISNAVHYPWANGTTGQHTIAGPATHNKGVLEATDTMVGTADYDKDGRPDVLIRDSDGYLYLLPTVETRDGWRSGDRVEIGSGWNGYTIAGLADWDKDGNQDIVAREDSSGLLWLYPGEGKRAPSTQARVQLGPNWNGYTFVGLADYDRDGKQDLITRDVVNDLYLYPGEGARLPFSQQRALIGNGWGGFTYYGVVDQTADGKPDIIAEYGSVLYLYPGSGTRAPYTGNPGRYDIGNGWAGAEARTIADFNRDGVPDIVARVPWSTDYLLYPGALSGAHGGSPWSIAGRGITTGDYQYRVTAGDWQLWGPPSGWCEFSVDVNPPDAPTFSSSVYKTTGCPTDGCGSLGIADTFTFASTSTDVVKYKW
ncbi:FG-GAP-like repeat-containing protein, partial [Lentzea alba]|uniref:FG-GAP-like repeat-containing protein n=1 Tax=Lentzea alba TaxID=2714351 RepID=UPI0039BF938A